MSGRPLLSSTPLQISYSFNAYYDGFFIVSQILLIIYKVENLPYPGSNLALDVVLLLFLACLESLRIFLGSKGNLTEKVFASLTAVVLTLGSAILVFYFIFWQTYVLRVDVILCAVLFVFEGFQLLFSIVTLTSFSKANAL